MARGAQGQKYSKRTDSRTNWIGRVLKSMLGILRKLLYRVDSSYTSPKYAIDIILPSFYCKLGYRIVRYYTFLCGIFN